MAGRSSALRSGVGVAGVGAVMQSLTGEEGPGQVVGVDPADFVRQGNAP